MEGADTPKLLFPLHSARVTGLERLDTTPVLSLLLARDRDREVEASPNGIRDLLVVGNEVDVASIELVELEALDDATPTLPLNRYAGPVPGADVIPVFCALLPGAPGEWSGNGARAGACGGEWHGWGDGLTRVQQP
ncbi:MAG: hypothetical protein JW751_01865 [Polyangiaceae bacterium]|nr:hypothetical protein [Polyangiaceae bacterium]